MPEKGEGEGKITEINVAETLKDVRRALLEADVNFKVAKQFTDEVKAKALGMNVINAIKPGELMVKIVHDELARLMGGETAQVNLSGNPTVILMSGLQGSGKTTFSGKLARKLKSEQGKRRQVFGRRAGFIPAEDGWCGCRGRAPRACGSWLLRVSSVRSTSESPRHPPVLCGQQHR